MPRRSWKWWLIVGVSLAAALPILGELVARVVHDPPPVRRVWDPFSWRIPQPDLVDEFVHEGQVVRVEMNELGMRGPRISTLDPSPGSTEVTVVFLGGSAVENYAYAEPETYPALVAQQLERGLLEGASVVALNAGQSGAASATSLGRLQHQVLQLEPELVVVMDGINDLIGGLHPRYRPDSRHLSQPPSADDRPRSYLASWMRSLRAAPQRARSLATSAERSLPVDYDSFPARLAFARNLRSMTAVSEAHRVPMLLVTQPTTYCGEVSEEQRARHVMTRALLELGVAPPDTESLCSGMNAFNTTTLQIARTAEQRPESLVRSFDLAGEIAARIARDGAGPDSVFVDECHLTKRGNLLVAEILGRAVEEMLAETGSLGRADRRSDGKP